MRRGWTRSPERLQIDLDRPTRDLSSGNRRKVALLLAFAPSPDLLILDEPTSGLDPLMQHEFLGMVAEARDAGATVFLSSHVLSEVQRAADRVAVLRAGRIVIQGTVDELRGRARQRIEVWFADDVDPSEIRATPGLVDPVVEGRRLAATLSGPVDPVLAVLARHPVASLVMEEPNLEDAFLDLYGDRLVNAAYVELALGPLRQMRRSLLGWGIGLGSLVAVTVAFWPAFRGSSGISEAIDQLPSGVIDAFGLAGFGTPAGFLRGNLYEFIVPLLLAIAAVAAANGLHRGGGGRGADGDVPQPACHAPSPCSSVERSALIVWLAILTSSVLVVQLVSDAVVGLEIDATRVVSTVVLCGLLALLFGALALAVAGWLPRPSLVLAIGVAAAVGGYLIAALFPLSDVLKPLSSLSPWKWALGGDPLVNAAEPWRSVALIVPVFVLVGWRWWGSTGGTSARPEPMARAVRSSDLLCLCSLRRASQTAAPSR